MDTAQRAEECREKNRAAVFSLVAALALTSLKLAVGLYTNSLGILSEALHSGLDLVAAAVTLLAVRVASRPADDSHPYGHGKVENLSALAETLLLFTICFWVAFEAVERLLAGSSPVTPSVWGVVIMAVSMAIDINRVRVLRKVAQKYKSQALEADALHFSTDIMSSAVVLVGVLAVWLAAQLDLPGPVYHVLAQADTLAALLVALLIFRASLSMAMAAINTLMDSSTSRDHEAVVAAVEKVPGIISVRQARLRTSGPQTFVELTVGVEPRMRVREGHKLSHEAAEAVKELYPDADVTVHVEPQKALSSRNDNPFFVVQRVASEHGLGVHNVHVLHNGSRLHVELHVELPQDMPYTEAHKRVTDYEDQLSENLNGAEVVSHIEPEGACSCFATGASISLSMSELILAQVKAIVDSEPLLSNPHDCSLYDLPEVGMCLCLHCQVKGWLSVHEVNVVSMRLEKELRTAVPGLGRIVTHMEPEELEQS